MKEHVLQFGPSSRIKGVLTEPARAPKAAMVLVSAGLVPQAGPYRLYAELARHLAKRDLATLRFDLGGIGDTAKDNAMASLRERTQSEIGEAVRALRGASGEQVSIGLGGLCSGAEDSFRYARNDRSISRVVLIDPFAYPTPGFQWRHLAHRATRRTLRALGVYRPSAALQEDSATGGASSLIDYKYMGREEATQTLDSLVRRGARAHFIYTGGSNDVFNHEGQLQKMFPTLAFDGRVTVDWLPAMDHTQILEEDRLELIERIADRLG